MFRKMRLLDYKVTDSITRIQCRFLDKLMVYSTYAGTGALIWWLIFAVPFVISQTYRYTGITMIVALGVNYLLGEVIIKKTVGRGRPSNLIDEDEMKINKPKDNSFPSGHTASSFCAFTVTLWNCPVYFWLPALLIACLISFSRLYLRVHYLSDVIGGILLGLTDGSLICLIFNNLIFV